MKMSHDRDRISRTESVVGKIELSLSAIVSERMSQRRESEPLKGVRVLLPAKHSSRELVRLSRRPRVIITTLKLVTLLSRSVFF